MTANTNKKITKAVILCGGLGTRMLPYTKSQPKEMLPVLTTPLLQRIMDQVVEAGIKEVFILISSNKECIVKHFDDLFPELKIFYARQTKMLGTGPATLYAKDFVGKDPFLLIFPDELMFGQNPYQLLCEDYAQHQTSVLSSYRIPLSEAHRYGIIIPKQGNEIAGIIEKPTSNPPSDLASLGTYVLDSAVFDHICTHSDVGKEICIVDAINQLPKLRHVELSGHRFDLGSPLGFAKVNTYVALQQFPEFKTWLENLLKEN